MSAKKPIKDWGIVKLFSKHIPNVAGEVVGGLAEVAMGENPISVVKDRLTKTINESKEVSPEIKEMLLTQLEDDLERARLRNEDRADARAMQRTAIIHGNNFTRNFVYYYASALLLIAMGMTFMLFFLEIPERNASIINMAYGVIFTVGLYGSFTFFFGDTEKTKIKQDPFDNRLT